MVNFTCTYIVLRSLKNGHEKDKIIWLRNKEDKKKKKDREKNNKGEENKFRENKRKL
jgi:hypothetical protein